MPVAAGAGMMGRSRWVTGIGRGRADGAPSGHGDERHGDSDDERVALWRAMGSLKGGAGEVEVIGERSDVAG
jgi:hypothetical protein